MYNIFGQEQMATNNKDKEKYSKINIVDEETTELKKRFIGNFSKEEN